MPNRSAMSFQTGDPVTEIAIPHRLPLAVVLRPHVGRRYMFQGSDDHKSAMCIGVDGGVYLAPIEQAMLRYLGSIGCHMDIDADGMTYVYASSGDVDGDQRTVFMRAVHAEAASEQRAAEVRAKSQ
jgi:hypothetical protein